MHDQIMVTSCIQTEVVSLQQKRTENCPHEYLSRQKFAALTLLAHFPLQHPFFIQFLDPPLYLCACHNTHICCSCLYIQDGETPLDLAIEEEEHDVVECLQQQLGESTISIHTEILHEL